jgi:hypothetical protein
LLLQLLSLLGEMSNMIGITTVEHLESFLLSPSFSLTTLQEALEQIEDTIDCLWSYKTAMEIATQIQTQSIDVNSQPFDTLSHVLLEGMSTTTILQKDSLFESFEENHVAAAGTSRISLD